MSCWPTHLNFEAAFLGADKMTTKTGRRRGVHFNTRSLTRALGSLYERTEDERKRKCIFQDLNASDSKWLQLDDNVPAGTPPVEKGSFKEEVNAHAVAAGDIEDMDVSDEAEENKANENTACHHERKFAKACKVKDIVNLRQGSCLPPGAVVPRPVVVPIPPVSPPSSEEDDDWWWRQASYPELIFQITADNIKLIWFGKRLMFYLWHEDTLAFYIRKIV